MFKKSQTPFLNMNKLETVLWEWDKLLKMLPKNMELVDKNKIKWLSKATQRLIKLSKQAYLIVKLSQLKQQS